MYNFNLRLLIYANRKFIILPTNFLLKDKIKAIKLSNIKMSYVKQVCDGYSKKSFLGNWWQERQYPDQPFRQRQEKHARNKDQGITCFDNSGFQRALPRIQRRSKWQTRGRIVLDDGYNIKTSQMKAAFPFGEYQSSYSEMKRPCDKTLQSIKSAQLRQNSELKPVQKKYYIMNSNNLNQQERNKKREVALNSSDFCSVLPVHPMNIHKSYFSSTYNDSYAKDLQKNPSMHQKTNSDFCKSEAGDFVQNPEQGVKPITTMVGQAKKQQGDQKQLTSVQRSWVPPKDKSISYSMGKKAQQFKMGSMPQNDIQTSLNINVGLHNIHPKHPKDGHFRNIRTDVTMNPNISPCRR